MTDELDWTELEELVQAIRMRKLKSEAGRPPHLRVLVGAVVRRRIRRICLRAGSGYLVDRTGKYWLVTFIGYIN